MTDGSTMDAAVAYGLPLLAIYVPRFVQSIGLGLGSTARGLRPRDPVVLAFEVCVGLALAAWLAGSEDARIGTNWVMSGVAVCVGVWAWIGFDVLLARALAGGASIEEGPMGPSRSAALVLMGFNEEVLLRGVGVVAVARLSGSVPAGLLLGLVLDQALHAHQGRSFWAYHAVAYGISAGLALSGAGLLSAVGFHTAHNLAFVVRRRRRPSLEAAGGAAAGGERRGSVDSG